MSSLQVKKEFITHTLFHEGNELKHQVEQQALISLLKEEYEILSSNSLPDRIIYVLSRTFFETDEESTPKRGKSLKEGVSITRNGKYYMKGKGFIKERDAYE